MCCGGFFFFFFFQAEDGIRDKLVTGVQTCALPISPYHTVVRLERTGGRSFFSRLFGGKQAPVLLEFDASADGPRTVVRRSLDLRDTPKGDRKSTRLNSSH